jgi:hypothetical protein
MSCGSPVLLFWPWLFFPALLVLQATSALHWAARDGHFDMVELLIKSGADVNSENIDVCLFLCSLLFCSNRCLFLFFLSLLFSSVSVVVVCAG